MCIYVCVELECAGVLYGDRERDREKDRERQRGREREIERERERERERKREGEREKEGERDVGYVQNCILTRNDGCLGPF